MAAASGTQSETVDLAAMNHVVVVGGAGFIGINLCRHLAASGVSVVAIDPATPPPDAFAGLSVKHSQQLTPAVMASASVVFHVAGMSEPASSNLHLREDMTGTVGLTLDVLETARLAQVPRVIHVSSGGTVYGPDAAVPTPESAPTQPVCAYGVSKLAAEGHVQLAERLHGIIGFNLRVANPYGPWQDPRRGQGVVNAFLYRALRDDPVDLWGEGTIVRDFLHVDDVVQALCRAAVTQSTSRTFNIGSGRGTSLATLIADVESLTGRTMRVNHHPPRDSDVPTSILDISKAASALGWQPQMAWSTGLKDAMDWITAHVMNEAKIT